MWAFAESIGKYLVKPGLVASWSLDCGSVLIRIQFNSLVRLSVLVVQERDSVEVRLAVMDAHDRVEGGDAE